MSEEKFFNICVYGLVSMLMEYAEREYGEIKDGCRYIIWESSKGIKGYQGNIINIAYRDIRMQFCVDDTGVVFIGGKGVPKNEKRRMEVVVEDLLGNLSEYYEPVSKVEGLLSHSFGRIRKLPSGIEIGSVNIFIGV